MASPRIGLFGTFDVENYGDLLFPRLFEREMRERLPSAEIRAFSPYGPEHPVAMNGGWSPEALGLWTRERLRELGDGLEVVGAPEDWSAWLGERRFFYDVVVSRDEPDPALAAALAATQPQALRATGALDASRLRGLLVAAGVP